MPNTVFDVGTYIIENLGAMTAMKLQKLCYYSQAWSIVWDGAPLFDEEIQAWANGPVIVDLYNYHRGQYMIEKFDLGDSNSLNSNQKETIDRVVEFYSKYNSQQLSDLTHMEQPWKKARRGIPDGVRSDAVISKASMEEYYSSL